MSRLSAAIVSVAALVIVGAFWSVSRGLPQPIGEPQAVVQPKTDADKFVNAAIEQIGVTTTYNPSYIRIPYPNGDIPIEKGVCTDVVIRALRKVGTDLQKAIHEDAKKFPSRYNRISSPDTNIDHRRCPNMIAYFQEHATTKRIDLKVPNEWAPGDIVFWKLIGGKDHVGVLSTRRNTAGFPYVVHNIGAGVQEEDVLMNWTLTARFRLPIRTF